MHTPQENIKGSAQEEEFSYIYKGGSSRAVAQINNTNIYIYIYI